MPAVAVAHPDRFLVDVKGTTRLQAGDEVQGTLLEPVEVDLRFGLPRT